MDGPSAGDETMPTQGPTHPPDALRSSYKDLNQMGKVYIIIKGKTYNKLTYVVKYVYMRSIGTNFADPIWYFHVCVHQTEQQLKK